MASPAVKRMILQEMFAAGQRKRDQKKADEIAAASQGIIGNQPVPEQMGVPSPYQNDERFPGEAPIQGLMNADTPAQPGTGLYNQDKSLSERYTGMNQRLLSSGIPTLQQQALKNLQQMQGTQMRGTTGGSGEPSSVQEWKYYNNLSPEKKIEYREMKRGAKYLDRATGFENADTGEFITKNLTEAERQKAEGKSQVLQRDKALNDIYPQIDSAMKNVVLYDEAVKALDDGAKVGYIENTFLPSFTEATLRLENIGARLGLQIISGVTFGALSEREMTLAMAVGMPKNMQPEALRKWLTDKKNATQKLSNELIKYAQFIHRGGNRAEWYAKNSKQETGGTVEGATATDPKTGNKVIYKNGTWQPAS